LFAINKKEWHCEANSIKKKELLAVAIFRFVIWELHPEGLEPLLLHANLSNFKQISSWKLKQF